MPKLYETRLHNGEEEIYMGEGEWVSKKEIEEVFQSEIDGRKQMDAADVMAEWAEAGID